MENLNLVRNGVLRLPCGFRFHPTDEELVFYYLKHKVFSIPIAASIIPDIQVCKYDPWDLPGDPKGRKYFFSKRELKYPTGNRSNRATGSGYWKATGLDKQIVRSRGNQLAGMKKTLVFYRGKSPCESRTDWIMHEYYLLGTETGTCIFHQRKKAKNSAMIMGDWVLCRIFTKKSSESKDEVTQPCKDNRRQNPVVARPIYIDFVMKNRTDLGSSSSSGSSGITEVSSCEADHAEISSCNSFSSHT